ncbi:hypothetical protein EHEL_081980 [Encephalitozoon hellem ATCC 50504]|uniref:Ricin B lectin domain-containing protein n=1 Tax=Encephalitozoon hellem TaxID=27973 RepID=A0A9Q9C493_ENCHE|nr:uncharacterized protein EHEL_081980 [Encephalitozoon hellem ATCC 50504]AFM98896.1 hypothetical protein EHEL_081980 [Encephalitozoon hellem ATCC 50504]UTX43876.1 hypothetical protein GPU96_08g16520 [Encephalitozoon hellem]WEL39355.1 hypothetical protein PFJ87_08g02230 [Encephalitozoon hellem]|eukprot:XP_003887877.1 hypothetical protein EHEL_081980 [Encephalitozoon hellem ATCC 50504]
MGLLVMLVISCIFCKSDPINVRIVSKGHPEKYLALFSGEVRLATKEQIRSNKGCSKFVVDEIRTEILQGNRRVCKKYEFSRVMSCINEGKNSMWDVIIDNSKFVSFKVSGGEDCITANGSESTDILGDVLSLSKCDKNSNSQKFWIKLIVNKKTKGS